MGADPAGEYHDHIRLWAGELGPWLPRDLFDAHVHLGPPEAMGPYSPARSREPLCTFPSLPWETLQALYPRLFSGKTLRGLIAFPFPHREVDMEAANAYLAGVVKRAPQVRGFILSHPTDTPRTRAMFEQAEKAGARFLGVKPYFDLLGKSNYECTMPEFIPDDLLEFMDRERLIMMLHTSGTGMGDPDNQAYIRRVLDRYPNVRIILAHMGRYLQVEEFYRFIDSDLPRHPSLWLEMSSASRPEVYARTLARSELWGRLLFGSDVPYGLITGVEAWSEETGPVFLTRDRYPWSDESVNRKFGGAAERLTYNTYHTIKALKDALEALPLDGDVADTIKRQVFCDNAASLFA